MGLGGPHREFRLGANVPQSNLPEAAVRPLKIMQGRTKRCRIVINSQFLRVNPRLMLVSTGRQLCRIESAGHSYVQPRAGSG